jgi:hypothetical protein
LYEWPPDNILESFQRLQTKGIADIAHLEQLLKPQHARLRLRFDHSIPTADIRKHEVIKPVDVPERSRRDGRNRCKNHLKTDSSK